MPVVVGQQRNRPRIKPSRVRRTIRASGAIVLTAAALGMAVAGADGIARSNASGTVSIGRAAAIAVAFVLPIGYVAVRESRELLWSGSRSGPEPGSGPGSRFTVTQSDIEDALAAAVAAPVTWWLAVDAGLGAIVGAALVGLLASVAATEHAAAVYCGAFVGMMGPAVATGYSTVVLAGAAAGVALVVGKNAFNGFGGKLGTTAFVGCLVAVAATDASPAPGSARLGPETVGLLIAAACVAAVATFLLGERLGRGPVLGSATVGLVAGIAAPPLLPAGETVAAVAFCASFTGMARAQRIPTVSQMLLAGLVTGVVFVGAMPYFGGLGGKLGTIAFVACLWIAGLAAIGRELLPLRVNRSTRSDNRR